MGPLAHPPWDPHRSSPWDLGPLPYSPWDPLLTSVNGSLTPWDHSLIGPLPHTPLDPSLAWQVVPLVQHDPLTTAVDTPVNLQLVGSDGAGTHAVETLGGLIFDAAEPRALPLSRAALDHCVGAQKSA